MSFIEIVQSEPSVIIGAIVALAAAAVCIFDDNIKLLRYLGALGWLSSIVLGVVLLITKNGGIQ